MSAQATSDAHAQFLSFVVGGEEYAVPILRVKEIIEFDALTRVPGMPACVSGVINLRGRVVPVVDLALLFGLGPTTVTRRTCIVLLEVTVEQDPTVLGVIVDAVSEVLELAAADIEPPPGFGTRVRAEMLEGMAQAGRKFVMILRIDEAFGVDQLLEGARALAAPTAEASAA